jgi:hypothetical protein
MVRAMGMAARTRINNNQRRVLQLQAQQNAYREVITRLQNFQRSFFDSVNMSSNLRSMTLFNQTRPTVSVGGVEGNPTGVTVTSGPGATAANYEVTLVSNASQARMVGNQVSPTSGGIVDLSSMTANNSYAVTVRVGTTTRNLAVNVGADGDARAALNNALMAFGTNNSGQGLVNVDAAGRLSSASGQAISISGFANLAPSQSFPFNAATVAAGTNSFNIQTANGGFQTITFDTIDAAAINALIADCNNDHTSDFTAFVNARLYENFEMWESGKVWTTDSNGVFNDSEIEAMFQSFFAAQSSDVSENLARHAFFADPFSAFRHHANAPGVNGGQTYAQLRADIIADPTAAATHFNNHSISE